MVPPGAITKSTVSVVPAASMNGPSVCGSTPGPLARTRYGPRARLWFVAYVPSGPVCAPATPALVAASRTSIWMPASGAPGAAGARDEREVDAARRRTRGDADVVAQVVDRLAVVPLRRVAVGLGADPVRPRDHAGEGVAPVHRGRDGRIGAADEVGVELDGGAADRVAEVVAHVAEDRAGGDRRRRRPGGGGAGGEGGGHRAP